MSKKIVAKNGKMCLFGCKSGYKSCSDKVHFFIVPKDKNTIKLRQIAILWGDMKLKAGHAICEKHFKPEDILQKRLTYAPSGVKVLGRASTSNRLFIFLISLK